VTATEPPRWTDDQFEAERGKAIALFREERMQEPLEQYLAAFDQKRTAVETLIEATVDLSELPDQAATILSDASLLEAVRYLASPIISTDDLKILADASLSTTVLKKDEDMARRVVDTVLLGLDRQRFPWMGEDREPTEAERETAIVSTSALLAARRVMTDRANEAKDEQENAVAQRLLAMGFVEVERRTVTNLSQAPKKGEFCRESLLGNRKADLIAGLWDGRTMPIECKVSNSSTNSIKRLNNDAAVKAAYWRDEFGNAGVVPSAVLAGVFKLRNLKAAQEMHLTIWWAHDLDVLADWITRTKSP
jgi:hypothetical protein